MFTKLLIANRGEIAVRIIRTCKRLGVKTVAVYSEADKEAEHVKQADESYFIGKSPVRESYLQVNKLIEVAKESGVEAIHPGYGLLSENSWFARRCEDEGLIFIGPSSDVIKLMGDKNAARQAMITAGVPVIPGSNKALLDEAEAVREASKIGYPVMLKAAAGGGGIGIQVVHDEDECRQAYKEIQKRAEVLFGDGTMILEKCIQNPRHIEVQLLADKQGHVIHLGERDCSIQRRHQKVIEEAPASFLTERTKKQLREIAITAAKSIGYTNAGTIEFLVDEHQHVYFLEMNTRIQVEHPVTEEITGIDLVEWQLRIASKERLSLKQEAIELKGHAIEVRIYAEDPQTFLPSPGTITMLSLPEASYIRHECPIKIGTIITPFYDPMIAKMIVTGRNRPEAIERLSHALAQYVIAGVKTNLPFLREIVRNPDFNQGHVTTSFVRKVLTEGRG